MNSMNSMIGGTRIAWSARKKGNFPFFPFVEKILAILNRGPPAVFLKISTQGRPQAGRAHLYWILANNECSRSCPPFSRKSEK